MVFSEQMAPRTDSGPETVEREEQDLADREIVWMSAPRTAESTDPSSVKLFGSQRRARRHAEAHHDGHARDHEWTSWGDGEGRQLVDGTADEPVGVVGPLGTTGPDRAPPFEGSFLERVVPSDSRLRSYLPVVTDRAAVDREDIPFDFFDIVLFSERGHLVLDVGSASGPGPTRYLEELTAYARKAASAAASGADDRVARSRVEELDEYVRVEGATAYYGKPRYRLAKRLSEWGGDPGRYACVELWLLFELLLRLYPEHVTWESGYGYHDDH